MIMDADRIESPPLGPHQRQAAPVSIEPRRRRKGRAWKWLVTLVVLAGLGALVYFYGARVYHWRPGAAAPSGRRRGQGPAPVLVATAHKGDMNLYINGLGTVTALNTITLRSRVDGELMTINFQEGQMVKAGELLAEIDPRPFKVQLEQAEGQLSKDRASLENAQRDLARFKDPEVANSVTQQQIDTQEALVRQFQGTLKSDQANVDNANLQLTYCRITAPISGKIGLRVVDKGNIIHASDPGGLAVITQLQPISVVFSVPQDDIPRVLKRKNSGEPMVVDAFDRDFSTKLASGDLSAIDNQVDPESGTIRLKATFANPDLVLYPNQFVNARLLVETRKGVVLVPDAAVQLGPNFNYAYVVQGDIVHLHKIVLGPSEGGQTLIESGLSAGDVVVTDGVDKLQDKSKVTLRKEGATTRPTSHPSTRPGAAAPSTPHRRGNKSE